MLMQIGPSVTVGAVGTVNNIAHSYLTASEKKSGVCRRTKAINSQIKIPLTSTQSSGVISQ